MLQQRPAVSPRRRRRREARTEAILQTAMRLVGENGIEGFTLQQIAGELDYAIGSLYRYFPSKGALLAELQRCVLGALHEKTEVARAWCRLRSAAEDISAQVGALMPLVAVALIYESMARNAPAQFGMLSLSLGDPRRLIDDESATQVAEASRPMFAAIARDLADAHRVGALALEAPNHDATANAVLLWASLHGVVQLKKLEGLEPGREPVAAAALRLLRSLLVGWGAAGGDVDRAVQLLSQEGGDALAISAADFESARAAAQHSTQAQPSVGRDQSVVAKQQASKGTPLAKQAPSPAEQQSSQQAQPQQALSSALRQRPPQQEQASPARPRSQQGAQQPLTGKQATALRQSSSQLEEQNK